MPYGDWINDLPTGFFLVVHIAAFALGAGFAWLAAKPAPSANAAMCTTMKNAVGSSLTQSP